MAIQTQRSTARYKDFYTNLDSHPVRKDLFVLTDADAVKNSIKNLIFTNFGERFFKPNLGCGIKRTLFENIAPETTAIVQDSVVNTIRNYEPRVDYLNVNVGAIPDDHSFVLTITFSLKNNPNLQTFKFLLTRIR